MRSVNTNGQSLRKDLSLFGVFAVATGTTLSAGFFVLPGPAFSQAGPAVVVSYLIAAAMMVAPTLCVVELATAMPRAGGTYFFLDRSLGPLAGTIGGLGTWLALTLKSAFALVGIGAYISIFFKDFSVTWVALGLAVCFGCVNVFGSKATTRFQAVLVTGLLSILGWFMVQGLPALVPARFEGFLDAGSEGILGTAGLVFISYVGVTKVASIAEEVRNPERNLPRGVFVALATAVTAYMLGLVVMVGVIPAETFSGSLTPVADAASVFAGKTGQVLVAVAAVLAFSSVANAGILGASRYPLAMGRDDLLPQVFRGINRFGTPLPALVVTVAAIVFYVTCLDVISIAKLASAFQLVMFAMLCLAVLVMRESGIDSYDPGFRTPLYPWVPLLGFISPWALITQMGLAPTLFALGLVVVASIWFFAYAAPRVRRQGAIYHVFARLGQRCDEELDGELRSILKEKGLRKDDPYEVLVARAPLLEIPDGASFEDVVQRVGRQLEDPLMMPAERIAEELMQGTRTGRTPVSHCVALPHLRLIGIDRPHLVLARSRSGMSIEVGDVMGDSTHTEPVNALIFLVSPGDNPALHLRVLAKLAGSLEAEGFMEDWLAAATPQRVREVMLRDDRFLSFVVSEGRPSGELAGIGAEQVGLPDGCLVALVNREGQSMLPDDEFSLSPGDRLTIIGEKDGIAELKTRYTHPPGEHAGDSSRCDHQAVEVVELRLESVSPSNDGGGQKSEPARRDSFGP